MIYMKKTIFSLILVMQAMILHAQETSYKSAFNSQSALDRMKIDITASAGSENKGHRMTTFGANIGYELIPRVYALAHYENVTGLHDIEGIKAYTTTTNVGGGFGIKLFVSENTGKSPSRDNSIDLYGMMAASVGSTEWKQTVYEAGIKWRIVRGISPTLSLSFRHTNSHTAGMPNHNGVFGTIGFGI